MNKNLIALAVAAAMAAPMAAQAEATVYGKLHASIDSNDFEDQNGDTTKSNYEVKSRASRIGLKGSEDLGGGLKAVYKVEFQVDIADDKDNTYDGSSNNTNIKSRNQYLGLAGGFGTFVVGRHDTPLKMSTGKLDFFGDTAADYNSTVGFTDRRADNAIAYISPNLNGLSLAAAIIPGEQNGTDAAGDEANGLSDGTSVAVMYAAGPLYLSAAQETLSSDMLGGDDDHKLMRVGAGYTIAGFDLGLVYETEDEGDTTGNGDRTHTQLSAKYNMGANAVKAMYGTTDDWSEVDESGHTTMGIGFDHSFSKSTKAYALYTTVDGEDSSSKDDSKVLSVGMITKF
jgi:predicted porin